MPHFKVLIVADNLHIVVLDHFVQELAQLTDASEAIRTIPDARTESPTGDPTTAYTQHPPRYSATATTQQFGRKRQQDVETLT